MLRELQRHFRAAVTTPDDGALAAHVAAPSGEIADRIDVYRTTVQASLTDALSAAFPVVARIVGPAFFAKLAGAFIAAAPPRLPQLSRYGEGFAAFIADFAPAASVPYLADVARLEWARAEAYFAADAPVLDPAALQHIAADRVAALRLALHPAARLVRSAFPIAQIWSVNQPHNTDVPALDMTIAENVLVTRPRHELIMRAVSAPDATLVSHLADGKPLGGAVTAALETDPSFSLQAALQLHLMNGTFSAAE